jgi:hypothetical protein
MSAVQFGSSKPSSPKGGSSKWLGFGIFDALTSTTVHFFPSAVGTGVPYPTDCELTVFGANIERQSVLLEGARLGQPDGVRLSDAFPALKELQTTVVGIQVKIEAKQPRIDLSASRCAIEIEQKGGSVRFWAIESNSVESTPQVDDADSYQTTLMTKDAFGIPSLVFVNSGDLTFTPALGIAATSARKGGATRSESTPSTSSIDALLTRHEERRSESETLSTRIDNEIIPYHVPPLQPQSALELRVDPRMFDETVAADVKSYECTWGLLRGRSLVTRGTIPPSVGGFVLYREPRTRRPHSVYALPWGLKEL